MTNETPNGHDGVMGDVLPMYFVGDVSWSMAGEPVAALNEMLSNLRDAVTKSPAIGERLRFGVVTFSDAATTMLDLSELNDEVVLPRLECGGRGTNYTAVFRALRQILPADIQTLKNERFTVRRPAVFFLSDGEPNVDVEHWQEAVAELKSPSFRERPTILAFGVGDANAEVIREVASESKYAWITSDEHATGKAVAEFGAALIQSMSKSADAMARGDATMHVAEPDGFTSLKMDPV